MIISLPQRSQGKSTESIILAGGCFWCMEPPFEKLPGVISVVSGYSGGSEVNPIYKDVAQGKTGHREVVEIKFNPRVINLKEILDIFWRQIDPTDDGGQFVDRGKQYSPAIFYTSSKQRSIAHKSLNDLKKLNKFKKSIKVPILLKKNFYPAEDYHQDYYKKSPLKYKYYRYRSGRDQFLNSIWGSTRSPQSTNTWDRFKKPSKKELKRKLSFLQYRVTQEDGTEPAFNNKYWDSKSEGIYVDIVSGEPLFSSTHKYKSGTGWPSFYKPIDSKYIITKADYSWLGKRIEVRSKIGDSHLGHVFPDGPKPTGLRYCMNSAALRFIPKNQMKQKGYGQYLYLFK